MCLRRSLVFRVTTQLRSHRRPAQLQVIVEALSLCVCVPQLALSSVGSAQLSARSMPQSKERSDKGILFASSCHLKAPLCRVIGSLKVLSGADLPAIRHFI